MEIRRSVGQALLLAAALVGPSGPVEAQAPARSAGPPAGALLVIGGGQYTPDIREAAMKLSGGADARWVSIPTAQPDRFIPQAQTWSLPGVLGARLTVLHTRDRAEADREEFVAPLRTATAVWFEGGRQYRLVDAYAGTRTEREIAAVLERGGLVAGTSAGATIMGSYLIRGAPSENNLILMAPGRETGFGFLRNVAVDQHLLVRRRSHDLSHVVQAHPGLLGIGIDEATAIVVQGNRFKVIGRSLVLISDGREHDGRPFYPLLPRERFDLASWTRLPADDGEIAIGLPMALAPGTQLTGRALAEAVAGKTIVFTGPDSRGPYRVRFAPAVTSTFLRGIPPQEWDTGTWRVFDEQICSERRLQPYPSCHMVKAEGDRLLMFADGLLAIDARLTGD